MRLMGPREAKDPPGDDAVRTGGRREIPAASHQHTRELALSESSQEWSIPAQLGRKGKEEYTLKARTPAPHKGGGEWAGGEGPPPQKAWIKDTTQLELSAHPNPYIDT